DPDDLAGRRARREHLGDAQPLQLRDVVARDRAPDDDQHVVRAALAEQVEDAGHERHVGAREDRDPNRVGVLLDRGLDDLLGRLVEARVDHLHACVAQRAGDDLRAAVVPVEARLRDHDANLAGQQHTGVSRQTPHVCLSASHISPIVTNARAASWIAGIRFALPAASARSRASAASAATASRRARTAATRADCSRSSVGSVWWSAGAAASSSTNRLTPTTTRSPRSTSPWYRNAASAISRWKKFSSIAAPTPPTGSPRSKCSSACRSSSSVRCSTKYEPPSGSIVFTTPVSCAITCWVRSARRTASSVGSSSASSNEFVWSDCVPPSTAASASIAVRTMFTSGCCAVSETPAVCAWKRIRHD